MKAELRFKSIYPEMEYLDFVIDGNPTLVTEAIQAIREFMKRHDSFDEQ